MRSVWPAVLVISVTALVPGCSARSTGQATGPASPGGGAEPGAGAFRPSTAVRWVRDSAEHRAAFLQVYALATAHVEEEAEGRPPASWGVVLDADETVLDNSLYQVEREEEGLGFTPESWREWTRRRKAVPLPGARDFLSRVRDLGGRIAIVTNRRESECPDTRAVFDAHGLPYDVMLCREDDGPGDKNGRFEAVRRGTTAARLPPLEIIAFVGDNIRDFPGLDQDVEARGEVGLSDFGRRYFVVPNPMYGSWE